MNPPTTNSTKICTANLIGTISVPKTLSGKTCSTFLLYHNFVYMNKSLSKDFLKFPLGPQKPCMWERCAGAMSISARRLRWFVGTVGQHSLACVSKHVLNMWCMVHAKHVVYGACSAWFRELHLQASSAKTSHHVRYKLCLFVTNVEYGMDNT